MEGAETEYDVALQVLPLKFDTERRWVAAELDYVRRRAAGAGRWWSLPSAGVYSKKDWNQYTRALVNYVHALDRHEQELEDGWLPFKIHVMNVGPHDDAQVAVTVSVENGAISEHKQMPSRPPRLDGSGRAAGTSLRLPNIKGFLRYGIKIRRHELSATFSKLEAGDSADLVRQTLYLHWGPRTRVRFDLTSRLVKDLAGELPT